MTADKLSLGDDTEARNRMVRVFFIGLAEDATMDMVPVQSSNLAAVGYDPEAKVLRIRFRSDDQWDYADVPAEKHAAMLKAPSVGIYFHSHIKPHYKATKVQPEPVTGRPTG